MIRLFNNWREFTALLIASAIFYFSGDLIQYIDPSSPVSNLGILHIILFGAAKFFFGIFCVGVMFGIISPIMDDYWDKYMDEAFLSLSPKSKMYTTLAMIISLLTLFILCCAIPQS